MLRALIWDVDGTVAETERDGHRAAFNQAFAQFGLGWHWDTRAYGRLLNITGGFERLLHFQQECVSGRGCAAVPASLTQQKLLARQLHERKNQIYAQLVGTGLIGARPGVLRLMAQAEREGVMLAVATTTSRSNVEALFPSLFHAGWCDRFAAVICADEAPRKKPDPMAYQLALARMGLVGRDAIAIEDSANGLRAAQAAGIAVLITRSEYFADDSMPGAAAVCADLEQPLQVGSRHYPRCDMEALRALHVEFNAKMGYINHTRVPNKASVDPGATMSVKTIYDFSADSIEHKNADFASQQGKVLLIVNTASECGFTPQFGGLEKLWQSFRDRGLVVVGFPSNEFGGQDPGSDEQIGAFCTRNYGVSFPMMAKVEVNGDSASPLWKWLKSSAPGAMGTEAVKWNFTKFLVGRDGKVIKRYGPTDKPESMEADIEQALSA